MAGRAGRITINPGTRHETHVPPIADSIELKRGDRVRLETSGGGGWGHPFDRPVDAVLYDARNGLVTAEGARADYGVAITPSLDVDDRLTSDLRAQRAGHLMFHRTKYVDNLWPQGVFAAQTQP
jgi:N-methylhydantoinase B